MMATAEKSEPLKSFVERFLTEPQKSAKPAARAANAYAAYRKKREEKRK